ncbi:hypothetical protein ABZX69_36980 [Streptomyces sp. NPDC004074]|uniref:hypothetical protein n=1 Tax=unclassified Streptomyces TaxID=2593676 RepID=UPI0033A5F607
MGAADDATECALSTHKPCPIDGCSSRPAVSVRTPANRAATEPGGRDHSTALCRRCGADLPAAVTEDATTDTGTPSPQQTYENAPDLRRELHQVLALGAERDGRRPRSATGPPTDGAVADRAWLLRRAALMDRMALNDPSPGPVGAAVRTAGQLVLYDRRHPHLVAGPHQPDATGRDFSHRGYVRQEYTAWTAAGRPGT